MTSELSGRIAVVGCGVTGRRLARRLAAEGHLLALVDTDRAAARVLADQLGAIAVDTMVGLADVAVVVLASPGPHAVTTTRLLARGSVVITMSDIVSDVQELLDLQSLAMTGGGSVVVGAGLAPGLSGLLAARLGSDLATVDEIHVAVHGTGGPSCALQHHRALGDTALGWHDGEWIERPGGSGRELCWFPEPIGPHDCYRAAVADPILLHHAFPTVQRVSARVSATRRDRMTARLPMLTPPHADGDRGALRVEVRGADAQRAREALVIGASGDVADLAAAVSAAVAMRALADRPSAGVHVLGGGTLDDAAILATACSVGVRLQEFTGVATS
jgi:NADP oxidoreductase coenzyme F420-dependent